MANEKEKIVVVGFGWVGQANALALKKMGHPVFYYDVTEPEIRYDVFNSDYVDIKRLGNMLEKDSRDTVYLVCVGDKVDGKGNQDISSIESALNELKRARGTVILRSTVLPHHLNKLNFNIYLPEFLHEKFAVEEAIHPHYFVVGKKSGNIREPSFIAEWRKRSYKHIDCLPGEASHIKYLSNIWNALRIAFVNEYGRSIHASSPDAENIQSVQKILVFLFGDKPYHQYGKAFGGHCLPKDLRAYRAYSAAHMNPALLEGILAANKEHEEFHRRVSILPEWFASWRRIDISGREALKALSRAVRRRLFL